MLKYMLNAFLRIQRIENNRNFAVYRQDADITNWQLVSILLATATHRLPTKQFNNKKLKPMKHRLFAGFLLVITSLFFVGCSSENATPDALQVTNLHEVDFSVFEKTLDELPSRAMSSRADETSSVPLSQTELFTELEVCLIPVNDVSNVRYSVRQLSTDDNFGKTKLYVPEGTYYLVAVAAKTKNLAEGHRITIKSNTEIDFPDDYINDMAYCYQEVTIGKEKKSLDVLLKRGVSAFMLSSADRIPANIKSVEISFTKGVGKVFNPLTGRCAKEEKVTRVYDLATNVNKTISITMFVLLPQQETKTAEVSVKVIDQDENTIKSMSFSNVHMVIGKRTVYKGPLFTSTTSASFTFSEGNLENVDGVHEFE